MPKFFVYSDEGYETFDTETEALDRALELIANFRSEASSMSGWDISVEDICWGEVKEKTAVTERYDVDGEEYINYGLVDA